MSYTVKKRMIDSGEGKPVLEHHLYRDKFSQYCPYSIWKRADHASACGSWCPMFEIQTAKYVEKVGGPEIETKTVVLWCCGRNIFDVGET